MRLAKKRKGMLSASAASRTSEAAIQPFTTDATVNVAHLESRISDFASDTLSLETVPRSQKGLHHFLQREAASLGMNASRSEKQRIDHNQGLRASIQASPISRTAESSSAAVVPLPVVREPDQEVRNSDPYFRRELEHLRRELERMRQVQEIAQEAPPLYEDERPGRLYV